MYDSNSTTIKEAQKDGFFYRSTSYCTPEELAATKSQTIQKSNKPVVKREGCGKKTHRDFKREQKKSVTPAPEARHSFLETIHLPRSSRI